MAFQAGYNKGATFDLDPAGGPVTLSILGWTVEDGGDVLEITHSESGGNDAYLAGISRMPGNVTANIDAAALPNAASPGIVFGAKGTITLNVGSSSPWSIHIMISKVHWASEVKGLVTYNFDYVSDSTSGSRTRPS